MREVALALLARREHSCAELSRKLRSKGFDPREVAALVARLAADKLVDDERFAEAFLHAALGRGLGPLRVQRELGERGVCEEMIATAIATLAPDWEAQVERVRRKRFGDELPRDFKERMRQARFLAYRGFDREQIFRLLGHGEA